MAEDYIRFNVLGTAYSLPVELCTKYPESRLAQIARRPPYDNQAAYVPCDPVAFQIMTRYLHTGRLVISDQRLLGSVKDIFYEMSIPFPTNYQHYSGLPTSIESSPQYRQHRSSPPPYHANNLVELAASLPSSFDANKRNESYESFQDILRESVHSRLTNLLLEHLVPLIHSQARSGIYRAAFVLVPSNITTLQPLKQTQSLYSPRNIKSPVEDVISLVRQTASEVKYLRIVRLDGPENTLEFLSQPRVIEELRRQLLETLGPEKAVKSVAIPPEKPSFVNRWSRAYSKTPAPIIGKTDTSETQQQKKDSRLEVDIEEISIRRENDMGLWETVAGEAVVVQVLL